MSSPPAKSASSLKDALESRPDGSFLFPEHVVVEDLLEQIDQTWTSHWEGVPRLQRTSSGDTSQATNSHEAATATKALGSWMQRTLRKVRGWRQKSTDVALEANIVEEYHSFVPRYPSWADWTGEASPTKRC